MQFLLGFVMVLLVKAIKNTTYKVLGKHAFPIDVWPSRVRGVYGLSLSLHIVVELGQL